MPDPGYTVIDQQRDTAVNTDLNRVERGWNVYYKDTVSGTVGEVFIPDSRYTAEGVATMIAHQIETVRAVHALGG